MMQRRTRWTEARSHTLVLTTVFGVLALALWFEPGRFDSAPSYANLMQIFPQRTWAVVYAVATVLMVVSLRFHTARVLVAATHTASIILLASWWMAFFLRWVTDANTTPVNVLSWGVFGYIAMRSALMVDQHVRAEPTDTPPPPPPTGDTAR